MTWRNLSEKSKKESWKRYSPIYLIQSANYFVQNMEFDGLTETVKRNTEAYEKYYQFLKRLNDILVPLIETVNGLLALSLKQEKEKK